MSLGISSYVHICKGTAVPVQRVRKLYGGRRGVAPRVLHLVRGRDERLTTSPDCFTGLHPIAPVWEAGRSPKPVRMPYR